MTDTKYVLDTFIVFYIFSNQYFSTAVLLSWIFEVKKIVSFARFEN